MSKYSDILNQMPSFPKGELKFVEMLKQREVFVANWDEDIKVGATDCDLRRTVKVINNFPDPEKLLDTAFVDIENFLVDAKLNYTSSSNPVEFEVAFKEGFEFEEYDFIVSQDKVTVLASDTEGARRGIYYLQHQVAGAPVLKEGTTKRKAWLRNRISRCFFGPIKRPPFNIDELMNDIDYYPEAYLSRLAFEGVNGLWLTVEFKDICNTTIRPAHPDADRRIAKLKKTVERCRRYGIKTWVFCIEPLYWNKDRNPLPPGCEELAGPGLDFTTYGLDWTSYCINSDKAKQYLYEATNDLFTKVPNLGGMLTISYGERVTSCISCRPTVSDDDIPCKKRCDLSVGQIMKAVLGSLSKGIKDANPNAELIAWYYMPQPTQMSDWIYELPSELEHEAVIAFNFESGVIKNQVGKPRIGGDYWLSAVGPSDRFGRMAEAAKGHCDFAAKLQAVCSHEVATVPEVPVPGLLYRKFKKMKQLGVKHVLQCWYFGNYPGLMNEAAGALAWEDFSRSEEEFLLSLAHPHWGKHAPAAVKAWKAFAEGYSNYPLDIQFQYYGPMHDGPVWPLHLKQCLGRMTRSWKPDNFPSGDCVGESMKQFELNEQIVLIEQMTKKWHEGFELIKDLDVKGRNLDLSCAEALDIQFASGARIWKFYALRNAIIHGAKDALELLKVMENIVKEEIPATLRLAELCKADGRLGYHSEAEVYKYFPDKLEWRARCLQELLDSEFPDVYAQLAAGKNPAEVLQKHYDYKKPLTTYEEDGFNWSFDFNEDEIIVKFTVHGSELKVKTELFTIYFMDRNYERKMPDLKAIPSPDNYGTEGWSYEYRVPRSQYTFDSVLGIGFYRALRYIDDSEAKFSTPFVKDPGDIRLALGYAVPENLYFIELKHQ